MILCIFRWVFHLNGHCVPLTSGLETDSSEHFA